MQVSIAIDNFGSQSLAANKNTTITTTMEAGTNCVDVMSGNQNKKAVGSAEASKPKRCNGPDECKLCQRQLRYNMHSENDTKWHAH